MPAAYNLGLGNHQFNYPSQADHGFPPAAPWFLPFTQRVQHDQRPDDEQATRIPELILIQQTTPDQGKDQPDWQKQSTWDHREGKILPSEKQPVMEDSEGELRRVDPATEDALFTEPLAALSTERANVKHGLDTNENAMNGSLSENETIPSPWVISAIAPAQMAALVAGLPGVAAPAESGDSSLPVGVPE